MGQEKEKSQCQHWEIEGFPRTTKFQKVLHYILQKLEWMRHEFAGCVPMREQHRVTISHLASDTTLQNWTIYPSVDAH